MLSSILHLRAVVLQDASAGRLLDGGYYQDGKASEIDGNVSSCMRCLFEHFISKCSIYVYIEDGLTLQLNPLTLVFFSLQQVHCG